MSQPDAFSDSYAQARAKFLAAAASAGLAVQSYTHPLPGRDGEALATDVVLDGPVNAKQLLIVSSACHGVEGFCGSGVQVDALGQAAWRAQAHAQGVAVLYVHALNPHGFSYQRRVTQENVDLNRNFQDFAQPLPVNEAYRALHALVLPEHWPPDAATRPPWPPTLPATAWPPFRAPSRAASMSLPTACSTAALHPPGATRPSGRFCATMPSRRADWPGWTCTPA
jgi:hypothetical protein